MAELIDGQVCFRLADTVPSRRRWDRSGSKNAEALSELLGALARRGAEFENLGVDGERLFARIARVPDGLFR